MILQICSVASPQTANRRDLLRDLKALSHGANFLATCNAILLLGDVILANTCSITIC